MNKKHNLNIEDHRDDILDDLENDKFISAHNAKTEKQNAQKAASNFVKRENRINIRISTADLNMIRRLAVQEGLPYQTLLASVIHKFVTGRLIDIGTQERK